MRRVVLFVLAVLLISATSASAYGPSIHMREADQYIAECELHPGTYPVHNPELMRRLRAYLRLGAIWPDIANYIVADALGDAEADGAKGGNSHHPDFVTFVLDDALAIYPNDPWKTVFAVGQLDHCTGDIVSQLMLVEHLAVRGNFGELDILPGLMDDHPGGEIEGIIEGGLEFTIPRYDIYIDMAKRFLFDAQGRKDLQAVIDYYLPLYQEYFPLAKRIDRRRAFQLALELLAHPREIVPPDVSRGWYRFAVSGFTDASELAGVSFDLQELERVLPSLLSPDFWNTYNSEGFGALAPYLLLTYAPGQPFYDDFPIWIMQAMKSGVIQSLAYYLPDQLETEDGRFLMDESWYADHGATPVTSIDAASPPTTVTLSLTFYNVPGRTPTGDSVLIRIREDSTGGQVVASQYSAVGVDPWTYDTEGPVTVTVDFDPGPSIAAGANGFFVELAHQDDPEALPYFTTNWSVYQQITAIDMTKACYTDQYSTYGNWPYSLQVIRRAATGGRP